MRRYGALHCVFAKMGPQTGEFTPGPSNIDKVALSTVTAYVCLMFVDAICGGRAPCIAYSQNRALKPTSSRRRREDSRYLYAHRREWYVFDAWRREPSGMRQWTASHCVFRQMEPPLRDIHPRALGYTYDGHAHHDRIRPLQI